MTTKSHGFILSPSHLKPTMDVDVDIGASDVDLPASVDQHLVAFDAALAETDKNDVRKRRGFCSQLTFVAKVSLALLCGSVLQIIDLVTDLQTIRLYMAQRRLLDASILSGALLLYIFVALVVGIHRLRSRRSDLYQTLWGGHWLLRALTALLHCVGLGQVPLSVDLAAERMKVRFGKNVKPEDEKRLQEKSRHYVSMSLLQTILG